MRDWRVAYVKQHPASDRISMRTNSGDNDDEVGKTGSNRTRERTTPRVAPCQSNRQSSPLHIHMCMCIGTERRRYGRNTLQSKPKKYTDICTKPFTFPTCICIFISNKGTGGMECSVVLLKPCSHLFACTHPSVSYSLDRNDWLAYKHQSTARVQTRLVCGPCCIQASVPTLCFKHV